MVVSLCPPQLFSATDATVLPWETVEARKLGIDHFLYICYVHFLQNE